MLGAVQEQRRPLAHERTERTIRLAGMQRVGVAEKNLAHGARVAGKDERRYSRHAHREPIAVAARTSVEEAKRIAHEIESREESRTWRQRHGARVTTCRAIWGSPGEPVTILRDRVFCICALPFIP